MKKDKKGGKYLKFVSIFMNIYHVWGREMGMGREKEKGRVKRKWEGGRGRGKGKSKT